MAKYYKVEALAGTEDEAVLRRLHVLEAYVVMAQPGMRLGQNCDRLGRRRRMDVIKKTERSELERTTETSWLSRLTT